MSMKDPLAKARFVTLAISGISYAPPTPHRVSPRLAWLGVFFITSLTFMVSVTVIQTDSPTRVSISPRGRWIPPCLPPEPPTFLLGLTKPFLSTQALQVCSRKPHLEVSEHQNQLQLAAILGQGCLLHTSLSLCQCDWEQARPPAEMKQICRRSWQLMDFFFLLSEQNQFSIPDILIGI